MEFLVNGWKDKEKRWRNEERDEAEPRWNETFLNSALDIYKIKDSDVFRVAKNSSQKSVFWSICQTIDNIRQRVSINSVDLGPQFENITVRVWKYRNDDVNMAAKAAMA